MKNWYINLITFLFFLSGGSAIIYQVVWHRVLYATFGINIEAVTIIVSVFMLGLGLGALFGGYLSKKLPDFLIQLFVIFEIGIACFGYISIDLIKYTADYFLQFSLWMLPVSVFCLICIPTLFMGATLPILVSHLCSSDKSIGQIVSRLYSFNTFGSAFFCLLTITLIFKILNLDTTIYLACSINIFIAGLVALISLLQYFNTKKSVAVAS